MAEAVVQFAGDAPPLGFLGGDELAGEFLARLLFAEHGGIAFGFGLALRRDVGDKAFERQKIAFLGGHPRSGTTLLEQILDAQPELRAFDEPPFR